MLANLKGFNYPAVCGINVGNTKMQTLCITIFPLGRQRGRPCGGRGKW